MERYEETSILIAILCKDRLPYIRLHPTLKSYKKESILFDGEVVKVKVKVPVFDWKSFLPRLSVFF